MRNAYTDALAYRNGTIDIGSVRYIFLAPPIWDGDTLYGDAIREGVQEEAKRCRRFFVASIQTMDGGYVNVSLPITEYPYVYRGDLKAFAARPYRYRLGGAV